MYTLHIANKNYSSWSLRPWVLMRELGLPFEEKLTRFAPDANFRAFSPSGRVPCLIHEGTAIWDSLAIVEFLAERHPGVWPADPMARAWARSAAAEMHSGFGTLRNICSMSCGIRVGLRETPPALAQDIARLSALWNDGLTRFKGPFLGGAAFTAVDAFFAPVAFRVQTYGLDLGPAANAYAARLLALPAMQSWYADALAETFRDDEHEVGVEAVGKLLQDLRAKRT